MVISILLKIDPSLIILRSKSANGCDIWSVGNAIPMFPFCVEAKAVRRLNIFKAFQQAMYNTTEGMLPLVLAKSDDDANKFNDNLATLRLVDFFVIMTLLNKHCPTWFDEFKILRPELNKLLPSFSKSKESFIIYDLQKVWNINGENYK